MKHPWKLVFLLLAVGLSTVLLSTLWHPHKAYAANPTTISFQGKVVNADGTNVTDGTYTFVFKLYTAASGGTALWTETDSLTVSAGVFQVNLGASCSFFTAAACNSSTPIDFNANPALYLGITFNSDPAGEMTPRVQLQSVPYAYNADKVGGFTAAQLAQLSPGSQQTGFINVSGNITGGATVQGATVTATGVLQGNSLSINSGTFAVSSAGAITASTGIVQGSGSDTFTQAAGNNFKLQTNAVQTADMFNITNSGFPITADGINGEQIDYFAAEALAASQAAALQLNVTNTTAVASTTNALRVTATNTATIGTLNGVKLDNVTLSGTATGNALNVGTGWTNVLSSTDTVINNTGSATFTHGTATDQLKVVAAAVPTADMFNITNSGFPVTADGINGDQIDYYAAEALAASQAAALQLNVTNTTAVASTTNALRVTATNTATIGTLNGVKLDNVTLSGTATGNALNVGTGWTNVLQSTDTVINNTGSATFTHGTATDQLKVAAGIAPTADMFDITNSGFPNTADQINGEQIDYYSALSSAAFQASALRLNVTNTTAVASTTNALRLVATNTATVGTLNGLKVDPVTISGTAVGNAINVGTGWTTVLQSADTVINNTGSATFTHATATDQLKVAAAIAPTADQFDITNTGFPNVTDQINGEQIDYYSGLTGASTQASSLRLNVTNTSTVTTTTTNGLRVVVTSSAATGATNGIKVDAITGGTGTESAIYIGNGWDSLLNWNGTQLISGTTGFLQSAAISGAYGNLTGVGTLATGSISGAFAITTSSKITDSVTGANALAVSGAPVATATISLVQFGGAIAAGNVATNGGTYIGINEPASGNAGAAADFIEFENNGTKEFNVSSTGSVAAAGSITGGILTSSQTDTTGTTYPITTPAFAYYLNATSATTNAAINSIFNITGLPAVDGTTIAVTAVSAKGATTVARIHTTTVEIAGTTVATLTTVSNTTAQTTTRSFTLTRINAVWAVTGEGPTAAPGNVSTVNSADYAEWATYSGDSQPQPGDVLSTGDAPVTVKDSSSAYDSHVVGVVSTSPYEVGGSDDGHSVVLALAGRVPVNVNLENGPIAIGDPLTASSTPGVAMKATSAGQIIGKALSTYDGSQPEAQVTVQLGVGYDAPTGSIVSPALTADGALVLDSGTSGDVSIDTGSANNYVNVGTGKAAGVNLSQSGQATTVAGALVIDQAATFHGTVTIDDTTDSDGLISTPNFDVNSAGDVTTNGSFISKGGGLQLLDKSGNSLFTIDGSGNSVLAGSLNLASASVSGGLTVGGDLNVAGLSTFQKLATFIGKTVFRQDVEFDGHITVAADSAGYASLRTGESTVHVSFKTAYNNPPVVSANTVDGQFAEVAVSNITAQGFDISLAAPATQDTQISWTAVGVNNPQTATNPLPTTP